MFTNKMNTDRRVFETQHSAIVSAAKEGNTHDVLRMLSDLPLQEGHRHSLAPHADALFIASENRNRDLMNTLVQFIGEHKQTYNISDNQYLNLMNASSYAISNSKEDADLHFKKAGFHKWSKMES